MKTRRQFQGLSLVLTAIAAVPIFASIVAVGVAWLGPWLGPLAVGALLAFLFWLMVNDIVRNVL